MAGNNAEMVRLKPSTKVRFDQMKGKRSGDTFIDEMLTYFETLGINPSLKITSPIMAVKEQASRIIEVVRGIEKSQNIILKSVLDEIKKFSGPSGQNISAFNPDEYLHIDQVQELLTKSESLEKRNTTLQEEVNRLKTEAEIKERKIPMNESTTTGNSKVLLEIVQHLEGLKTNSKFDSNIYEFDRSRFDSWIERLKSEINSKK